ncbi:MAG: hypothetical protein K8R21_15100 [Leptospira sp.]|nr:hypothetical protein [Leptospira sp.]
MKHLLMVIFFSIILKGVLISNEKDDSRNFRYTLEKCSEMFSGCVDTCIEAAPETFYYKYFIKNNTYKNISIRSKCIESCKISLGCEKYEKKISEF